MSATIAEAIPPQDSTTDVFISYAHEDRQKAKGLANALAARGWNVWWDRKISPGEPFDLAIERQLGTCKCAIVLWSARSVGATFVRNEARRAAKRNVLVPILLDHVVTPLEFENLQTADLTAWKFADDDPELETVFEKVRALSPAPYERFVRKTVHEARREFKAGHIESAIEKLEHVRPVHDFVIDALSELRAEAARVGQGRAGRQPAEGERRQRDLAAALGRVQALLESADLDAAEQALATAAETFGELSELRPLREQLIARRTGDAHDQRAEDVVAGGRGAFSESSPALRPKRLLRGYLAAAAAAALVLTIGTWWVMRPARADIRTLQALRSVATQSLEAGQRDKALDAVGRGLRINPKDSVLTRVRGQLFENAQAATKAAKQEAESAGSGFPVATDFTQGVQKATEAAGLHERGEDEAAIRSHWLAADDFASATARYRQLAQDAEQTKLAQLKQRDEALARAKQLAEKQRRAKEAAAERARVNQRTEEAAKRPIESGRNTAIPQLTEEQQIRQVLNAYKTAWERMDAAAISRLFPALSEAALRKNLADYHSYALVLSEPVISITGNSAGVTCTVTTTIRPKVGTTQVYTRLTTFQLDKSGSSWVITARK